MTTFVLQLLPFERALIDAIAAADSIDTGQQPAQNHGTVRATLFFGWQHAKKAITGLEELEEELFSADQELDPSRARRQDCYRAFLGSLGISMNEYRVDVARNSNGEFEQALYAAADLRNFMKSTQVVFSEDDRPYWDTLAAMHSKYPIELDRWVSGMPLSFDISDSLRTDGFEIFQLTRMYSLNLMRPWSGQKLLALWKSVSYRDLGQRIWSEYQVESAQKTKHLGKFFRTILAAPLDSFEPTEGIVSTSQDSSPHSAQVGGLEAGRSSQEVSSEPSRQASRPSLAIAKELVLFKTLAYGHLDYLTEQDIEIVPREQLQSALAGRRAEGYFWEMIEATIDSDVRIGLLPRGFEDPSRRLFYSDPEIFEYYLTTHSMLLLTFEDQARFVILTELPDRLLDLYPDTFWLKLNDCALMLYEGKFLLVQSTLGWLVRKVSNDFSEDAARQYLRRCIDQDSGAKLQKALGEHYKRKYDVFLLYIEPTRLHDIQFIGAGGNGKVYRAVWNRPSSMEYKHPAQIKVALKRIPYSLNLPKSLALEKFLKEMEIVYRALSGTPPGCIEFYGITTQGDDIEELFLVFEYATGGCISEYIKTNGKLWGWEGIISLFSQIAWALWDGLHVKKLSHGDLAPRNVLVTKRSHDADPNDPETDNPVLIDFGKGLDLQKWQQGNTIAIEQDMKAYGELIEQLAILWMEDTGHNTVPARLIEVVRRCKEEQADERLTMRQVVFILEDLERDIEHPDLATEEVKEISIEEAWKVPNTTSPSRLRQSNSSSFTPSYRRFHRGKKSLSTF